MSTIFNSYELFGTLEFLALFSYYMFKISEAIWKSLKDSQYLFKETPDIIFIN